MRFSRLSAAAAARAAVRSVRAAVPRAGAASAALGLTGFAAFSLAGGAPADCLSWSSLWGGSSAVDYKAVYADIEKLLESNPDYEDGSYGPLFVR